jgi:hypothetical protein
MPLGFFSRLLVRIWHSQNIVNLYSWREGILLKQQEDQALVEYGTFHNFYLLT